MSEFKYFDDWKQEKQLKAYQYLKNKLKSDLAAEQEVEVRPIGLVEADREAQERAKVRGLTTGYELIDSQEYMAGLCKGSMYVIGGLTSNGKTHFCCNLILNTVLRNSAKTLFLTTEMPYWFISKKLKKLFASIPSGSEEVFMQLPISFIDSRTNITPDLIEKLLQQEKYDLLVIDNLQWFTRGGENTDQSTGQATKAIKKMAIEFDLPVILVSHLNRGGYGDRAPGINKFKGSSYIEQDADAALMVVRNYDNNPEDKHITGEVFPSNVTRIHCKKNRLGETFNFFLRADENGYLVEDRSYYV